MNGIRRRAAAAEDQNRQRLIHLDACADRRRRFAPSLSARVLPTVPGDGVGCRRSAGGPSERSTLLQADRHRLLGGQRSSSALARELSASAGGGRPRSAMRLTRSARSRRDGGLAGRSRHLQLGAARRVDQPGLQRGSEQVSLDFELHLTARGGQADVITERAPGYAEGGSPASRRAGRPDRAGIRARGRELTHAEDARP